MVCPARWTLCSTTGQHSHSGSQESQPAFPTTWAKDALLAKGDRRDANRTEVQANPRDEPSAHRCPRPGGKDNLHRRCGRSHRFTHRHANGAREPPDVCPALDAVARCIRGASLVPWPMGSRPARQSHVRVLQRLTKCGCMVIAGTSRADGVEDGIGT